MMNSESSVDIEVIKTVFIFIFYHKRYFKHLKHKQNKVTKTVLILFLFHKRYFKHLKHKKKHLSNFHQKHLK